MKKLREILEQNYTLQQNVERLKNIRSNTDAFLSGKIGLKDLDKSYGSSDKPTVTKPSSADLTGSRYDLGGGQSIDPSSISNKPNAKRELGLRKDYRSPPAGYPSSIKDRLAGAEAGNEPPTPGSGPYKTKQSDPLKTSPIIVTPDKPFTSSKDNTALAAAGYDQSGKKVTAIPKKTGVSRAEIPLPSNLKIPSGTGITTPGSMSYTEPKQKKQITDRVPQQKIQDRVPQSAISPKPTSAGPYAPAKPDDPFHQRYAKTASYLGQVSRDRKAPEKKEPIQNLYQINKGDTLEGIARKIGGKNWKQTLDVIRKKNPKIKEKALKIGSELLLPEAVKPITSRIKPDQTYVPQSAINSPSSVAGPFITGASGAPKNTYNYKVPGLLDKNMTVASKQQEPSSMIPKPKLRPRISDDEAFITAVKDQESKFNPKAISPKGAAGLMQVMPKTGAEIAKELDDAKYPKGTKAQQKYLQNPEVSDLYGKHYLNKMYTKSAMELGTGDEEKLRKATLAAYNAGFGGSSSYRKSLKTGEGNPKLLPKETRNYVPSILSKYEKNKSTTTTIAPKTPETNSDAAAHVQVLPGQNATTIAKKHKLSLDQLEKLNPGITDKSNKNKLMPGDKIKIK